MKVIKISLAVIVLGAIAFYVIRSFTIVDEPQEIKSSGNPIIDKIQQEIKAFQLKPDNKFSKEYYNEVVYHIEDYYENGRLGKSKLENDQWKDNLSKQLYAAYADKFIKQAFYVFNGTEWAIKDLEFIRNEYRILQLSPLLERSSPFDRRFNEIKVIISKYDEITGFISSCQSFSFSQTDLDMQFPLDDVKNRISVSNNYRNNRFGNNYVNNCTRLHSALKDIPQGLFQAHVRYLDNMISQWTGYFSNYTTQKAYVNGLFNPIENKINELDNNIYSVSNFDIEYSRLKSNWEKDGAEAYTFFNK